MEIVKSTEWLVPVKTVSWSEPLGVLSLVQVVEPWKARSRLLPDETCERSSGVELTRRSR